MKTLEPDDLKNFTEDFQDMFRKIFSKPKYLGLGKEVKDEDEKLDAIVGFWTHQNLSESEKLLLINLGVTPDQAYFKRYTEENGTSWSRVYFERDGEVLRLNFGAGDYGLNGNLEKKLESERKYLMEECYIGLGHESDWVFYDEKTGRSYGTTTTVEIVEKGCIAEQIIKVKHRYLDDEGNDIIDGLFSKINHSEEVTNKERKVLEGIIANEDLKNLKVSAPEVYGSEKEYLFLQNLKHESVEEYLKGANKEKRKDLLERIVKATEIIEREIIEGPGDDKELSQAYHFGNEHEKTITYLREKGMFDRELSDSRLNNWLYDEENDVLYKIDENAPKVIGSKYSCLARIADFADQIPEDERDELVEVLLKEGDSKKDAFLSLYITNMDTAIVLKEMWEEARAEGEEKRADKLHEYMVGRLERAEGYLDRLNNKELKKEYDLTLKDFFKL